VGLTKWPTSRAKQRLRHGPISQIPDAAFVVVTGVRIDAHTDIPRDSDAAVASPQAGIARSAADGQLVDPVSRTHATRSHSEGHAPSHGRARAIANQAPGEVTSIRTARAADRIVRASAFDLTEKPHRSAPMRLRRLTDPRRDPVRTDLGGASPYHPRVTPQSPTGQTVPDQDALTCNFLPALD
jgi:hypothetical protein